MDARRSPADESARAHTEALLDRLTMPTRAESAYTDLARALGGLGQEPRSEVLERASELLDGDAPALTSLASALYYQSWPGCELAAIGMCVHALRADPGSQEAAGRIGQALGYVDELADAQPLIDEALALTGRDPALLSAWGAWLSRHGGPELAHATWREALAGLVAGAEEDPENWAGDGPLAETLGMVTAEERSSALARVEKALRGHVPALVALGTALTWQSWPEAKDVAADIMLAALRIDPASPDAIGGIGMSLAGAGELADPRPLVQEALELTGRHPVLVGAWAAWLWEHEGRESATDAAREAVAGLMRAMETRPDDPQLRFAWGSSVGMLPDQERSFALSQVEDAPGGSADSWADMGVALSQQWWPGSEWAAARFYLAALRADPGHRGATAGLAGTLPAGEHADVIGPVIEEALVVTSRDPALVAAWGGWLCGHGQAELGTPLVREALEGMELRLASDPDQWLLLSSFASALGFVPERERSAALARVEGVLSGRANPAAALARALADQMWTGASWASARLYAAALRADPQMREEAVQAIAHALRSVARYDEAQPLVDDLLTSTERDLELLGAWVRALVRFEHLPLAENAALEYVQRGGEETDEVVQALLEYYVLRRRLADAHHWLDRVEAVVPGHAQVAWGRAWVRNVGNQPHRAVPVLSELVTREGIDAFLRHQALEQLVMHLNTLCEYDQIEDQLTAAEAAGGLGEGPQGAAVVSLLRIRQSLRRMDVDGARRQLELARAGELEAIFEFRAERLALLSLQERPHQFAEVMGSVPDLREAAGLLPQAVVRLPLREAAIELQDQTGEYPELASALYFELGLELAELERHQEAIAAYRTAHERWTEPLASEGFWLYGPYSLHNIATTLENEGRHREAVEVWREVAREYEEQAAVDDPYAAWARSTADLRLDRLASAYDACLAGILADPESLELLGRFIEIDSTWRASESRRRIGSPVEAPDASATHRTINPSNRWRGREASRRLRMLLDERSRLTNNPDHHAEHGEFLLERSEFVEAGRYLRRAVRGDPESAGKHVLMARLHEGQGEYAEAIAELSAALDRSPDDYDIRFRLGSAHASLKHRDEAIRLFAETLTRAPAHIDALVALADLRLDAADESGDRSLYLQAVQGYTEALDLHEEGAGSKFLSSGKMAAILYQRGYARVRLYEQRPAPVANRRLLDGARKDFVTCLRIDPSHVNARSAESVLQEKRPSAGTARERVGPWVIVTCSLFIFAFTQVHYAGGRFGATYVTLSFGSLALAIAGLFLPELLKLKVGGVELEKSPVDQSLSTVSFDLKR